MRTGLKHLPRLLLFVLPMHLCAQQHDMEFEHLSASQGLVGTEVHCILQDSRGFMWFGTEAGLNRYDGYSFTVYRHEPGNTTSIVDAKVQCLWEDKQGTLWIGTWNGLERFDRESNTFTHFLPDPHAPSGQWSNVIYDLREDRNGTLWVGGDGVKSFNRSTGTFTFLRHDSTDPGSLLHDYVDAIFEDRAGALWIGTVGGLDLLDPRTNTFTHYWVDQNIMKGLEPDYYGSHWIQKIYEDRSGLLWLCTNGGPVVFNRTTGAFKHYAIIPAKPESSAGPSVSSICEDDAGILWIGTWERGLMAHDTRADSFVSHLPTAPTDNSICSMHRDKSGIVWIGSNGEGLYKGVRMQRRFTAYAHRSDDATSLQNNDVRFIYQAPRGAIAIGTAIGCDAFDPGSGAFRPYAPWDAPPFSSYGFLDDGSGILWAGTAAALHRVHTRPYRRTAFTTWVLGGPGGSPYSIFKDRRGLLWMLIRGTGLCQFDPQTETFKNFRIGQTQPFISARLIVEDSMDNTAKGWGLWIGTNDGLWRYDARTDAFARFGHDPKEPTSLASNTVTTVFRDTRGTLWVGTDRGLNRMDSTAGRFEYYSENNGLPDNHVFGILEDDRGRYWVSTWKAISKFDPGTQRFTTYRMQGVLPDIRFGAGCCLRSTKGDMYFGGNGGFVVFHPDSIRDNRYVPPVAITGFRTFDTVAVLDSTVDAKKVLKLSYKDNVFSFEFAALNFTRPEDNQYAYKLEGHDSAWTYCGNRQYVRYINVGVGTYTFRVKGSNNDGVWNEEGASIAIVILPPFWATWWFRGFASITMLVSIGGSIRYVEMRKLKRQIELLEQERAVERERVRISQDMHDEVGSSLTEIAILSELAKKNIAKPGEAGTHVQQISDRAAEVIDNIGEIIWAINPKNDSLDNVIAHIRHHTVEYLKLTSITCRFVVPDEMPTYHLSAEARRNVFLVVKEAIHNVVKHSQASEVMMRVTMNHGRMEFQINDNGKGFSCDEKAGSGNGLHNMEKRIEEIGGTFHIESQVWHGTNITITVSLPNSKY